MITHSQYVGSYSFDVIEYCPLSFLVCNFWHTGVRPIRINQAHFNDLQSAIKYGTDQIEDKLHSIEHNAEYGKL